METYSFLRELADSWVLLAMFVFFMGIWAFAFWPSLQSDRDAAAAIPFKDDTAGCKNACASCSCKTDFLKGVQHD